MTVPGLPPDDAIKDWLGGLEPAWRLLDHAGLRALRRQPSPAGPIRLATDLTPSEIRQSAVTWNTLSLLSASAAKSGLKLTATGNLARSVVAEMMDLFDWPDFDKEEILSVSKVVNEPDFLPLYFVRHLAFAAQLLRKHKHLAKVTKTGRRVLEEPDRRALQAVLFHVAFWRLDLSYFGRSQLGMWPQNDIGILLWSLSSAADHWQSPERLMRFCTIPTPEVLDARVNPALVMEAKILHPLRAFGLMEIRDDEKSEPRWNRRSFYRKSPLFDRFLAFDVTLATAAGPRH
jgi:hypothetical protein